LELYTYFRSTAAYRVRIALNLKGLAWTPHYVSLPKLEHKRPDFLAVNPQGLLPALRDGSVELAQSLAILEYLEETHPQPPLLPEGAAARAYVRSLSQVIACDIHPLNNLRVLKFLEGRFGLDQAKRLEWYRHWIAEGFRALEGTIERSGLAGRFCYGDSPTMADVCLVPQIFNAERFDCPLEDFPRCLAIRQACDEIEAFATAHPAKQPDAA